MNKPLLVDNYELKPKKDYIVVTKPDVNQDEFIEILKKHDIDIKINFSGLERHYQVSFLEEKYDALLAEDAVLIIEDANRPVTLMTEQLVEVDSTGYGGNWGLTRICRRNNWNDSTWYPNTGNYVYFRDGEGVDAYIVDTGCRITHTEFDGRANVIFDYYLDSKNPAYGIDTQGHGTHVASTIGGAKYGVAKKVNLLISRVFENGGATLSAIVAGINACAVHHKNKKTKGINRPSIMNLSLGGPANITEEQAINDCINEGIVICAAAGNDGKDLGEIGYDVMPAEIERAITVGSCDIRDRISSFSNYGKMIDIFAPGHYICAAGISNDTAENMLSGTSMATPHVVGVCALYAQGKEMTKTAADVSEIHDWIKNNSTADTLYMDNKIITVGTPNRILFSEYIELPVAAPKPVTEVTRTSKNEVTIDENKSDPVVTTTYVDNTISITNVDGSVTNTTTRMYTDISIITITTTTTTVVITTIYYSDGTSNIVRSDPSVNGETKEEVSTATREEILSQEVIPAPKSEINRTEETESTSIVTNSAPVITTTYVDNTTSVVNNDGSTTKTTIRTYTDITTFTVTTTITDILITTITYNDGTVDIVRGTPIVTVTTEEKSTTKTYEKIIGEVVVPAPATPTPVPGVDKKGNWRKRGKWSRVKHLARRIEMLEKMLTSDHDISILDPIEDAADKFVDANEREKREAFYIFMDEYYKLKQLLK